MIKYMCPYCQIDRVISKGNYGVFKSWLEVRQHLSHCDKNTKTYMICEYYGPIHIDILTNYDSIQQFKKDFPKLTFSSSHWYDLRNSGKSTLRSGTTWTRSDILNKLLEFKALNGRIPISLEFRPPQYPSRQTVCEYFGSWSKALKTAGLPVNTTNLFGVPTKAKDNVIYRSKAEAYFVDKFLYKKYSYLYEPKYNNGTKWLYDFYIEELDLFIELTAYIDPDIIAKKLQYNIENHINCKIIPITEIYKKEFKLC